MKVIHLTLSLAGGAGIACRRLHDALVAAGVDSHIWTAIGHASPRVHRLQPRLWRWRARLDRLRTLRYRHRRIFAWWSNNIVPSRIIAAVRAERPDIIHLHWIGDGWIHPSEIAHAATPLVWTLHDAWAATGGCHYPDTCRRYERGCGACPQLGSKEPGDLSASNFRRKQSAWSAGRLLVVTPSQWLGQLAANGATRNVPQKVIPNGLDMTVFSPGDRKAAREALRLAANERVFLAFCTGDEADLRKGVPLLAPAIAAADVHREMSLRVLVIGDGGIEGDQVPVTRFGPVKSESELVSLYRAADALLLPSLQDNLPNTAVEAIACGCPVIGFAHGGVPDIIVPGRSGFISAECSATGLGLSIRAFLALSAEQHQALRRAARAVAVERFGVSDRARDYIAAYESLIASAA